MRVLLEEVFTRAPANLQACQGRGEGKAGNVKDKGTSMTSLGLPAPRDDPPSGPDPPYTGAGTLARVECTTTVRSSDSPKQAVVTTFFMISSAPTVAAADWTALATQVGTIFYPGVSGGSVPWNLYYGRHGVVRAYNMADPKPRPERGVYTFTPGTPETAALGPREVALCLSYYGTRNLPRQRGRVFLGPFLSTQVNERPTSTYMNACLQLGVNLVGPVTAGAVSDWALTVWSRVSASAWPVTNCWVNDVWDHHGERGQPETTRVHHP